MAIKKLTGYLITAAGLIILAVGLINEARSFIEETLKIPLFNLSDYIIIGIGGLIIIAGLYLITKSPRIKKNENLEVPIYQGKEVVGFRRT